MTDQSPNEIFHASSFMQGHNAEYLEQLYARYATDPNAVDEAWQAFFRQLGDTEIEAKTICLAMGSTVIDLPFLPADGDRAAEETQEHAAADEDGQRADAESAEIAVLPGGGSRVIHLDPVDIYRRVTFLRAADALDRVGRILACYYFADRTGQSGLTTRDVEALTDRLGRMEIGAQHPRHRLR